MMAVPDDEMYEFSCEEMGTCDDSCSPPAREDCLLPQEGTQAPQVPAEAALPETGGDPLLLLVAALCAIVAGRRLVRRSS